MTNKLWDVKRKAVYELLRELRVSRNITQVELCSALTKPQSYVSKYETGERKLDLVEIQEICVALDLSLGEFCGLYEKRTK